jgi:transposase
MYATGIADLTAGRPARLCDVVAGRSGVVLATWLHERDHKWKAQIATASLDPFRGYATALNQRLPQAVRVLDPFYADVWIMPMWCGLPLVTAATTPVRSA